MEKNITINSSLKYFQTLDQASSIIGLYVNTLVCTIGIFTNFGFLIALCNKKLKYHFYQNLYLKTFCDWVVCLIGIGRMGSHEINVNSSTYCTLFYDVYIIKIPLRIALIASTYAEIYLLVIQCIYLFKGKTTKYEFNKWIILICIYLLSISLSIPAYVTIKITKLNINEFSINSIKLESTALFLTFNVLGICLQVLPIFLFIILNVICVIKYRRALLELKSLRQNSKQSEKSDRAFTKPIIILSSVFCVCKSFSFIVFLLSRMSNLKEFELNSGYDIVLRFCQQVAFLIDFSFHVFNSLLYINMDSKLKRTIFAYQIQFSCKRQTSKTIENRNINAAPQALSHQSYEQGF